MKSREELKLEPGARVIVRKVKGDLKLRSQEGQMLTVLGREGELEVTQSGREVIIECRGDCRIRVPEDAIVALETVGGDAAITDLLGGVEIGNIGGDLSLRRADSALLRGVGGDLSAKDIEGDLNTKTVGGDCWIGRVGGQTRVEAIGGDASINQLGGSLRAMVGGDAALNLREGVHGSINVDAGGDISVRLPQSPSVKVSLKAGGSIRSKIEEAEGIHGRSGQFVLGDGDYEMQLSAGGSIWIGTGPQTGPEAEIDDIGANLASKIEEMMAEAEASLSGIGEKSIRIDSEGIGERVRRIVNRAVKRGAIDEQMAAVESALGGKLRSPAGEGVTDDERLQVLRMVEAKKITVEEAEALLEALGDAA